MKVKNEKETASISQKTSNELKSIVEKKCKLFQDIIQKTILNIKYNKTLEILGTNDVRNCTNGLNLISRKVSSLISNMENMDKDEITNDLQIINNDLSVLFKTHGTNSFDDLLTICFGNNTNIIREEDDCEKYELLKKYFHPTSYKVINLNQKKEQTNKLNNLECFDISTDVKQFHMKVYGIKVHLYHNLLKKNLMIYGIIDDVMIDFLNNEYINSNIKTIKENIPDNQDFNSIAFTKFIDSLTLKDYLTINSHSEIYERYIGITINHKLLKQKTLNKLVKDFIISDLFSKRATIVNLLLNNSGSCDNKYLAYLLYDLLSNDSNGKIDTQEQTYLFDSLPWSIKQFFRDAMKSTIEYTNDLANFDMNKIPLEQQICLLKVNDNVKEKAMMKLKEIKSKSEDSGSKARQYLDGLLKIPFNVYIKEPIMNLMDENNRLFIEVIKENTSNIQLKEKYMSLEMIKYLNDIKQTDININSYSKNELLDIAMNINNLIGKHNIEFTKIKNSGMNKEYIKDNIIKFIEYCNKNGNKKIVNNILIKSKSVKLNIEKINSNFDEIKNYINESKVILDSAVYGHNNAKKQIERIIGQWINGKSDGYCFGFEGPPGVGKTSLAKHGLAYCLKDDNNNSRPFSMIQMGGDSNGSSLHGHNYTYVGSTWGSIVQILIDKKCMNPIILIDEVDKISKTEHGKEIIGILTHLLDPAQNECFQDKYFTGIDLDLSKALFILSYNDPDAIDKILLDRIHRVKFSTLSLEDKLVIANKHILPEIYKKVGLEGMINIPEDVIKLLIDDYTCEAGVRKLKEILFEIVSEINLDILKNSDIFEYPINIEVKDIKNKYFKDNPDIKPKKIHDISQVGTINGLWANSLGQGGVIPIQASWRPSENFLNLHLTGMQGDVMKESMNVALTLAWNLISEQTKRNVRISNFSSSGLNINGIHVHCPEGAVPKDGPSAGAAITTAIYSLLTNKVIRNDIAMTGEISLDGYITQIGGLDLKIIGGIKGGVKEFIYPEENNKDFENFMEKYKDSELIKNIKFNNVKRIEDVFKIVFE
jgi:endopeptidase La